MIQNSFKFEDLIVYKKALETSQCIYSLTQTWISQKQFNIADQLQRASLSIPLNIAEGSSISKKDFSHFLSIAKGSCYECIALITIASNLGLMTLKDKENLYTEIYKISKMLSGLKNSLTK